MLYEGFKSKVICGQNLTEEFDIKTGVKQGCILSPFLFCLAIDWIMKTTDIGVKSGIIWTFTESLGDLDFADDISLLAHSHRDIQSKTEKLVRNASKVGLHVNKDKTKTMRNNCQTAHPVKLGEQDIEDVTEFTYLGAKVTKDGNTEAEIKKRINKARGAFAALGWVSRSYIVSKNLRSICNKHTMMLRLEKRVTGKDRKALVSRIVTSGRYNLHACATHAVQPTRGKHRTIYRQRACLLQTRASH